MEEKTQDTICGPGEQVRWQGAARPVFQLLEAGR